MPKVAMIPLNAGFKPPPRGEDLPTSDGEPMESWRHEEQMNLLIAALNDHWRDRDDFYVDGRRRDRLAAVAHHRRQGGADRAGAGGRSRRAG